MTVATGVRYKLIALCPAISLFTSIRRTERARRPGQDDALITREEAGEGDRTTRPEVPQIQHRSTMARSPWASTARRQRKAACSIPTQHRERPCMRRRRPDAEDPRRRRGPCHGARDAAAPLLRR